jgi:uridylate kinase
MSYEEALARNIKVMDAAAFQICLEQKVPEIRIFSMDDLGNILRVARGE